MERSAPEPTLMSWRTFLVLLAAIVAVQLDAITTVDASTPEAVQVALAESAGPVGREATIYVIGPQGYKKVREGRNGFTCLISRERRGTLEPECFDVEGTATVVPVRLFAEAERAAGASEEAIKKRVDDGYASGRFIAPRKPGIVYRDEHTRGILTV